MGPVAGRKTMTLHSPGAAVTCKLQGDNPYTYLVDVLQRISEHPASQVIDLTPRVWKEKFSHDPMKSDLVLVNQ